MKPPQPAFVLALIANPDLALTLILVGILLIYAEFNRPGTVLFACFGTLFTTIGVYALAQHRIDHVAFGLVCAGLITIPFPLRFPPFAFFWYLVLLCGVGKLLPENPRIHVTTAIFVSLTFSVITLWLGRIALQARRNKRLPNPTPHPAPPARRVD